MFKSLIYFIKENISEPFILFLSFLLNVKCLEYSYICVLKDFTVSNNTCVLFNSLLEASCEIVILFKLFNEFSIVFKEIIYLVKFLVPLSFMFGNESIFIVSKFFSIYSFLLLVSVVF